ncbi:MAG TPA: hypothetical protein VHE83_03370 [Mycobacteriales bacterium]|nr:hypothetical protein [Mycobacteriales bacterium]
MRFRTRAALTATAAGCAAAAALAATVLPTAAAVAEPRSDRAAAAPQVDPAPSDSASPSASPSDSASPSESPSPSASPSATPSTQAPVPGAPLLSISGPTRVASGDEVTLSGRVLLPDGTPAPLRTPVTVRARELNLPTSSLRVIDTPVIGFDGTFSVTVGVTRATYFSARATNLTSHGEVATTKPVLVLVKGTVDNVKLQIVRGALRVSAALAPGQRARVNNRFGSAALYLVTAKGKAIRKLATVNLTKPAAHGGNAFVFPLVALPKAGSYVRVFVQGTQVLPALSKALRVPVLYVPPPRRPNPTPSPSPGVHSIF